MVIINNFIVAFQRVGSSHDQINTEADSQCQLVALKCAMFEKPKREKLHDIMLSQSTCSLRLLGILFNIPSVSLKLQDFKL